MLIVSGICGCFAQTLVTLYIAVFLLGVGWNFCYIAGSALLSDHLQSEERGRAQGVSEAIIGVTAATGSITSGLVYASYGYIGSNLIVIGLSVVLVIIFALLSKPNIQTSGTAS
jgi:MFS family permease